MSAGRSVFASKLYVHPALPAVPFSLDAGGRADAGETPATQRAAGRWIDLARIEGEPLLLRTRPVVDTAARVESMAVKLVTTDAVYRTLIDISDSGSTESRPLDWERLLESLSAFGTRGDWTFLAERRCLSGMRLGAPTQGDACWVTRRNAAVGIGGTEAQAGRSLLVWIESGASPADAPYVHGAEIRDGRPAACARLLARLGAAPAAPVFGDSGVPDGARSGPVVDADTVAANERGRFELSTQRYRMVVGASELFVASPSELWRIPLPEDLRPGASQDPDAGALPAPQGPPR